MELLISGRPGAAYGAAGVRIVLDAMPDQGPLGGLAPLLTGTTTPHVLVLAVDNRAPSIVLNRTVSSPFL